MSGLSDELLISDAQHALESVGLHLIQLREYDGPPQAKPQSIEYVLAPIQNDALVAALVAVASTSGHFMENPDEADAAEHLSIAQELVQVLSIEVQARLHGLDPDNAF